MIDDIMFEHARRARPVIAHQVGWEIVSESRGNTLLVRHVATKRATDQTIAIILRISKANTAMAVPIVRTVGRSTRVLLIYCERRVPCSTIGAWMMTIAAEVRLVEWRAKQPKAVPWAWIFLFQVKYKLAGSIPFLSINLIDQLRCHFFPLRSGSSNRRNDVSHKLTKQLIANITEVAASRTVTRI